MPPSPHLFFYPAVLAAAYLGGLWAGVIAVVGSCLAIAYSFLPPVGLSIGEPADALGLALFAVMGFTLAWLIDRLAVQRRRADAAREVASHADMARAQTLSFVSHDLKGPLTAITLSASRMGRVLVSVNGASDTLVSDLERIKRSADRMQRIVETVLDVARVDVQSMHLDIARVAVRPLIEEVTNMFEPIAAARSVRILTSVSVTSDALCDRDRMLRVLTNLLDNAVKFAPERGVIEIAAKSAAHDIVFEVTNSGPGISLDALPKVFNPYWKADQRCVGQGLGLYIVKRIVEKHGGSIAVESTVGVGVTFRFTIPAAGVEARAEEEFAAPSNASIHPPGP